MTTVIAFIAALFLFTAGFILGLCRMSASARKNKERSDGC